MTLLCTLLGHRWKSVLILHPSRSEHVDRCVRCHIWRDDAEPVQ